MTRDPEDPASADVPSTEAVSVGGAAEAQRRAVSLDAKGLRALAHPVRVQLVDLLRRHGASTATQLAERTGLTSGATSYHLRQLAAAGFIVEDPDRGNARERWWRSLYDEISFGDRDVMEREPEATLAYVQSVAADYTLRAQRALSEFQTMPRPWNEVFEISNWALRVTPEEAVRLRAEVAQILDRYRSDTPVGRAEAPKDAQRLDFIMELLPDLSTGGGPADESGAENGTGSGAEAS